MTAKCPTCERDCPVRENFRQATRREPMRFLGLSGYCAECGWSFRVETPQLQLVVR